MNIKRKRVNKANSSEQKWIWGVVLIFFGVCFILITSIATPWLNDLQVETLTWPSVEGKIVVSELLSRYDPLEEEPDKQWDYKVDIVFQYTVSATAYNNSDLYYRAGTGSDWGTEVDTFEWRLLTQYPVNSTVTVYYNPDNPDESCLIPGIDPQN